MSFGTTIKSYVYGLISRSKSVRKIWELIKKHYRYKFTTNSIVSKAIASVKNAIAGAKIANQATTEQKIGASPRPGVGSKRKTIEVGYTFRFEFPNATKHRKPGKGEMSTSIEVPAGLTKRQVRDLIMKDIEAWVKKYYEHSSIAGVRASIKFTTIQEV